MLACRIVALVTNIPGPLAAASLAQLGAHVVKIEPPAGDPLEVAAPAWYARLTAPLMQVRRLNLREREGAAALESLLDQADLLVTAMRGGALMRLGLSWESLHARRPRLCHVAIVGEGAPDDNRAGHDLTYQARAGIISPPAMPPSTYADLFAGERAVAAACSALYDRERSGVGTRAEIAIAAGAAMLADPIRYGLTRERGPLSGAFPEYALYRAADGWIALAALEPHFQARLSEALGIAKIDRETLARCFAQHSCAHWEAIAAGFDLPLARVAHVA
jgi:crotonobetainyl-CoA:carnitine CoA-transferase CaiB-like acyl-CoA transferase